MISNVSKALAAAGSASRRQVRARVSPAGRARALSAEPLPSRLPGGRGIVIRPLRKDDAPALLRFLDDMARNAPGDYEQRFPKRIAGSEMPVVHQVLPHEFVSLAAAGVFESNVMIDASGNIIGVLDYSAGPRWLLEMIGLAKKECETNIIVSAAYRGEAPQRLLRYSLARWKEEGYERVYVVQAGGARRIDLPKRQAPAVDAPTPEDPMPGSA